MDIVRSIIEQGGCTIWEHIPLSAAEPTAQGNTVLKSRSAHSTFLRNSPFFEKLSRRSRRTRCLILRLIYPEELKAPHTLQGN